MLASELIKVLQEAIEEYGDLPVEIEEWDEEGDITDVAGVRFVSYPRCYGLQAGVMRWIDEAAFRIDRYWLTPPPPAPPPPSSG